MARVRICLVVLGLTFILPASAYAASWSSLAPLATARAGASGASVSGQPYAFGGWTGSDRSTSGEFLGGDGNWHPTSAYTSSFGLQGMASGVINGKIYLAGGWGWNGTSFQDVSTLRRYDPATDKWTTLHALPVALASAAAVVHNGMLYLFGGNTDPGGFNGVVRTVYRYSPTANTWKTLAQMPTPRMVPSAVVKSGTAYVIGGYNPQSSYVGVTEAYSFSANKWTAKATLANGRYQMSAGLGSNGMIYMIGGFGYGASATNSYSTEVDQYNPTTNTWTRLADAPIARADAATAVIGGKIYIMGGSDQNQNPLRRVDVYTP